MKYDVAIAYRCYPKISKDPKYWNDDKLKMIKYGLKSLVLCLGNLKAKFFIIADWIPNEWKDDICWILGEHDFSYIYTDFIWNIGTRNKQIDILSSQKDADIVYFAEDDYLYSLNWEFKEWFDLLKENKADFITLYDHPDYYTQNHHRIKHYYVLWNKRIRSSQASTCLTFMTTKKNLIETKNQLKLFKEWCRDHTMWQTITHYNIFRLLDIERKFNTFHNFLPEEMSFLIVTWVRWRKFLITKRKYRLFSPFPSIATHLESPWIAPIVNRDTIKMEVEKSK